MGWRIVSRESPQECGRRSRLWLSKDVFHVLKKNTGTEIVKGIVLDFQGKEFQPTLSNYQRDLLTWPS
ncbi:hypothetical protein CMV_020862 [Castanea mollissima]|uniref:Uncharacterized protein n=1 Tax=Castanea mollissima TaxID=60419 RepID=A0A8J4QVU9_9ROSI|nr:hypothetical protein CMV_020862 [Castanea mollissima]